MAGSIGVNPVVVRSVTGMLRRAGLVATRKGVAGAGITRPLRDINLLDVYRAVQQEGELFSLHTRSNPNCPVGAGIQASLESFFGSAQQAMETRLREVTLEEVKQDICARNV